MSTHPDRNEPYSFVPLGGIVVAIGDASVEITTLQANGHYRLSVQGGSGGGGCVIRDGATDAAPTNANFDFVMLDGESLDWIARSTTINVEELDTGSAATAALYIQRLT